MGSTPPRDLLDPSVQAQGDRQCDLLSSRLNEFEYLRTDDPGASEITSLREGLEPIWRDIPPLLELFADPRWIELEAHFSKGRAALRCFAALGPLHAGTPRRFGRLAAHSIATMDSLNLLMYLYDPEVNQAAKIEDFFVLTASTLRLAASETSSLDGRLGDETRARQAEAMLIEGYGLTPEIYRGRTKQMRRDLRKLENLIWEQIGAGQPKPVLVFFDRFILPGLSILGAGSTLAVYQPFCHNRIAFSEPALNQMLSKDTHAWPEAPDGLSLADLMEWDPCNTDSPKASHDDLVALAIHEMTHALSFMPAEALTPESPYRPDYERFCRERQIALPATFARVGLAQVGAKGFDICFGLGIFNELLTEAAAMEIRDRIGDRLPSLRGDQPSAEALITQIYRQGLDLPSEFLPGLSPLSVLMSDAPAEQLAAGIKKRLSVQGASRVLAVLFNSEEFQKQIDESGFAGRGHHIGLWFLLRGIIAEDDASKAHR